MFFDRRAKREAREKQEQETLDIEDAKLRGQLQETLAIADPAERYIAVCGFGAGIDARLNGLQRDAERKKGKRRNKTALIACAPFAVGACFLEPVSLTVMGVTSLLGSGLVAFSVPFSVLSRSLKDLNFGDKKIARQMLPELQIVDKYRILANQELLKIAAEHITELALSPQAAEITKLQPALKDAMLEAFRKASGKPEEKTPGPPQIPAPAPRKGLSL